MATSATGLWTGVMHGVGVSANQPDFAPFSRGVGMAQQRLPMRKIRDVLRLSAPGLPKRPIGASLGIGPTAAGACLRRAREAGVGWPLPDDLDDNALERRLYPVPTTTAKDWRSLPDWPAIPRAVLRTVGTPQLGRGGSVSSITPARRSTSSMPRPVRCMPASCSSPPSAHRA